MLRLLRGMAVSLVLLAALLWTTGGKGTAQELDRASLDGTAPPGGTVFACPGLVHIYEPDIQAMATYHQSSLADCTLKEWYFFGAQQHLHGNANSLSFWDHDASSEPGDPYTATLKLVHECPMPDSPDTRTIQNACHYGRPIPAVCTGTLYEDWTIEAGNRLIGSIFVTGNATLRIAPGATLRVAGGPGSINVREGARLEVHDSTLVDISLALVNSSGWVRGSQIQSGTILIWQTLDDEMFDISGNTFLGPFSPQLPTNKIELLNESRSLLQGNRGAFGLYVKGQSEATLLGNRFEGYVSVERGGNAWLESNVITGSLFLDGYHAPEGSMATATLLGTTITATETESYAYNLALHAGTNSRATVVRSRLANGSGPTSNVLDIWPYGLGSEILVSNSELVGIVRIRDLANATLYGDTISGKLLLEKGSETTAQGNMLCGPIVVHDEADITAKGNIITTGRVLLDGKAEGEFRHNTFLPLDATVQEWAFRISHYPKPDPKKLTIAENCIERGLGLIASDMDGRLVVRDNWWGHSTGPFHFPGNPEGKGAMITIVRSADDAVDYTSYLQVRPAYCRVKPLPVPQSASAVVGPQGGRMVGGFVSLDFPVGAVNRNVRITILEQGANDAVSAAAFPPTGDLAGNLFFDLSAVEEGSSTAVKQFAKPFELTVFYDPTRLGAREGTLALYWWNGKRWLREASSAAHPDEDTLTASPDHMTLFALLGEAEHLYLPQILR